MVDLFATRYNRKLDLFVSPVPDPLALDADALSISWENLWAYAFPLIRSWRQFSRSSG